MEKKFHHFAGDLAIDIASRTLGLGAVADGRHGSTKPQQKVSHEEPEHSEPRQVPSHNPTPNQNTVRSAPKAKTQIEPVHSPEPEAKPVVAPKATVEPEDAPKPVAQPDAPKQSTPVTDPFARAHKAVSSTMYRGNR